MAVDKNLELMTEENAEIMKCTFNPDHYPERIQDKLELARLLGKTDAITDAVALYVRFKPTSAEDIGFLKETYKRMADDGHYAYRQTAEVDNHELTSWLQHNQFAYRLGRKDGYCWVADTLSFDNIQEGVECQER